MRKLNKTIKILTVLATVLSLSTIVQGEEIGGTIGKIKVNTAKVIKIKNGINSIDLNGDGKKDMVIGGYRGHITAHSFTIYSFYVYKKYPMERQHTNGRLCLSAVVEDS